MIKSILFVTIILISSQLSTARPWRVEQIPNGNKYQCSNCHYNPGGGGQRNPFGQTVEDHLTNGNVRWDLIFNIDSDGDGFTNGEELQDPNGQWAIGQNNPGDKNLVSKVWDPSSHPTKSSVENTLAQLDAKIFPTPSKDIITLKFISNTFGNAEISFYNLNGNKLYSKNILTQIGQNEVILDLKDFLSAEGTYFLIVRNNYFLIKKKIIFSK